MIEFKSGEKKKIKEWLGIKASRLSNIFAERKRPGAELAIRLEGITGISCKDWRYLAGPRLAEKILRSWRKHNENSNS